MRWFLCWVITFCCLSGLYGNVATFRLVTMGGEFGDLFTVNPATSKPIAVRLASNAITGPYPFRAGSDIEFFIRDGTGQVQTAAVVRIPSGIRQPLVILRSEPRAEEDGSVSSVITAAVMDDSQRATPRNSVRFINVSSRNLAVRFVERQPVVLGPGQERVVRYRKPAQDYFERLDLAMQSADPLAEGGWERFGDGEFYLIPDARYYVFLKPLVQEEGGDGSDVMTVFMDLRRIPPLENDE